MSLPEGQSLDGSCSPAAMHVPVLHAAYEVSATKGLDCYPACALQERSEFFHEGRSSDTPCMHSLQEELCACIWSFRFRDVGAGSWFPDATFSRYFHADYQVRASSIRIQNPFRHKLFLTFLRYFISHQPPGGHAAYSPLLGAAAQLEPPLGG